MQKVMEFIQTAIMPPLKRQALTGLVIVPVTTELLLDADAQAMLVDIFSERGYRATIYDWSRQIPESFDLKTGKIITKKEPTFRVEIRFQHHGLRG
jgi:adenylate kinase